MDRYIDPNSGAAPQPGGFSPVPLVEDVPVEDPKPDDFDNHTEPGDERTEAEVKKGNPDPEPLSDELQAGPSHDAEVEHSGGPSGEQPGVPDAPPVGPVAPYAAPGVATDEEGNALGADGESLNENGADQNVPVVDPTTVKVEPPKKSARKEDWITYAKDEKGASDEDLEGLTRDQLAAKYGETS